MQLFKSIEYAIRQGRDAKEKVRGALEALREHAPEFECLQAALPGGVEVEVGEAPKDAKSRLSVEMPTGIAVEALAGRGDAFGSLHAAALEEAAGLLRRALRPKAAPGSGTAALHGGGPPFVIREPAVTPIYATTAYEFDSVGELEEFLADQEKGYIYSRWGNPTVTEAQDRLAAITGSGSALLFSSGMGAISSVLLTLLGSGDKLVALRHLYGGTVSLVTKVLPRMGVEVELIGFEDIAELGKKLSGAKVFYFESVSNPTLRMPDIEAIAGACRKAGVTSVCDNTFATPYNLRTLEHGVDVEVYSGSKFLSGHCDLIVGAACGSKEMISQVNLTMRYLGTNAAPFEAFLLSRGLRTLNLRMERHNENAFLLAERLEELSSVSGVWYPGLPCHPDRANARVLAGGGGMVTFEVKGGLAQARLVAERLRLARSLTTLGTPETGWCIPVLSSHYGLSPEVLAQAGVTEGMIRVSVGLEDPDDIIADFEQALGIRANSQ
jgi:methionine-gamma-lyase